MALMKVPHWKVLPNKGIVIQPRSEDLGKKLRFGFKLGQDFGIVVKKVTIPPISYPLFLVFKVWLDRIPRPRQKSNVRSLLKHSFIKRKE